MEVLVLPVDDELYAVPLEAVREVIARPRSTNLPTAPEPVRGLLNVRGEIVPLFDIAGLLSRGLTQTSAFSVVVELSVGSAGLVASAAPTSEVLGAQVGESEHPAARGVFRQGERLTTLLDLERLLAVAT